MGKLSGSCLCGNVRYDSDAEPLFTVICHCTNCQKQSGSAFSTIVGVPKEAVTVEGEDKLADYIDRSEAGDAVRRRFCRNCGSPVFSVVKSLPDVTIIKAGTLEDRSWIEPVSHVWCRSAQPWVHIDPAAKIFTKGRA